jgi:tetratricopeptide (TPR) repeat protein
VENDVSQRVQLALTVAAVAIAAAGAVVGITLETRNDPPKLHAQPGKPPVPRTVPGPDGPAIRQAFVDWPKGSVATMSRLQQQHPDSGIVQFYAGLAYVWSGHDSEAEAALERAKKLGRDTPLEVSADSLLHPQDFTGDPPFQVSDHASPLLRRGAALQHAGRRHSAERLFQQAARAEPDNPEALAAAAFGRFDKDNPAAAFSRMGPLAKRFPRSQSVRFNLGLMLAWIGEGDAALTEFRKTVALGPATLLGRDAGRFVSALERAGTGGPKK